MSSIGLSKAQYSACETVLGLSDWAIGHVRQVQRLADLLYVELAPYHALADEEPVLLAAALLHDVGYPTDPDRHNKVSARIIRSHLGAPFTAEQVEQVALLARYHRETPPKLKHRRYARLSESDRRLVCWLGGILRVADGLDRNHDSAVRGLRVERVDSRLEILVAGADCSVENLETDVRGALRKRDLLERTLEMPVVVRAVPPSDAKVPGRTPEGSPIGHRDLRRRAVGDARSQSAQPRRE